MSNHPISKAEKLAMISKVEELRKLAKRLDDDGVAVQKAKKQWDKSFVEYVDPLIRLVPEVRELGREGAKKLLSRKYGKLPSMRTASSFLMKLTYLNLKPKKLSKYLAVVQCALEQEGLHRTTKTVLQKYGRINGCAKKAAKIRKRAKKLK